MTQNEKNLRKYWVVFAILAIIAVGAGLIFWLRQGDAATVRTLTNQGIADMERFDYNEASKKFEEAVFLDPSNKELQINFGIALLNQATDESLARAIRVFQGVLSKDATNPNAHFCLGIIAYYQNRSEDAAREFRAVLDQDPNDAFSWYYLGKFHPEGPDSKAALECLTKALELDPYLNAARYALALHPLLNDAGQRKLLLDEHERLKQADWERTQDIAYTQMGPYANMLGAFQPPKDGRAAPIPFFRPGEPGPTNLGAERFFASEESWPAGLQTNLIREARDRFGGCLALADFAADGLPDAFLGGAVLNKGRIEDIYLAQSTKGQFEPKNLPLPAGWVSWSAVAADLDNDGFTDLAVCGPQGLRLLRNNGKGELELRPGAAAHADLPVFGVRAVDLDQDGDLDLVFVVLGQSPEEALDSFKGLAKGPGAGLIRAWINQGEAPPTPPDRPLPALSWSWGAAAETLFPKIAGAIHIMLADPDNDGDLDLVVFGTGRRASLIFNDRLLRFSGPLEIGPDNSHPTSGLAADFDMDGFSDLLLNGPDTPSVLLFCRPSGTPGKPVFEEGMANAPAMRQAVIADLDRNGSFDVLGMVGGGRPGLIRNSDGRLNFDQNSLGTSQNWPQSVVALAFADGDADGKPDIWIWYPNAGLEYRVNGGNGNQGLRVQLTGKRDKGDTLRTNNDAIGAKMEALEGRIRCSLELATHSSGPAQSMLPVDLGVGRALSVTTLRIRWPDRVVQAEKDLSTAVLHKIPETNRKATSCPVLFVDSGTGLKMVTDLIGAGAMGEQGADGSVRPPRPFESYWIDPELQVPADKPVRLSLAEPMDEVMYLDRVGLQAVDLPPGWIAAADERFVFSGPQPSGRLLLFPQSLPPKKAATLSGVDMTAEFAKKDGRFPRHYPLRSWLGFAADHGWELQFPALDTQKGDKIYLVLEAWTDYPYPESLYAASQAGVAARPLTLEIPDGKGGWKAALEMGVPAGLPKQMVVELTSLSEALAGPIRITTNLRVAIDSVRLARLARAGETCPVWDLNRKAAVLQFVGLYSEEPARDGLIRYNHDGFTRMSYVSRWGGALTKLGEIGPLLNERDDLLMIGGPGDELVLEFEPGPRPKDGFRRGYFLQVDGYCKDTAPFTKTGGHVLPWPYQAMGAFPSGKPHPREEEMKKWTTRTFEDRRQSEREGTYGVRDPRMLRRAPD